MGRLWIMSCGHWVIVTCHIPNEWLSVPTLGMEMNDDDFSLTMCVDGTPILELVRNFPMTSFLSFHPSLVVR